MTLTSIDPIESTIQQIEYLHVLGAPSDAEACRRMSELADWATNMAASLADTARDEAHPTLPGMDCLTCTGGENDQCGVCGAHLDWAPHVPGCGNAGADDAADNRELALVRGARRMLSDLADHG